MENNLISNIFVIFANAIQFVQRTFRFSSYFGDNGANLLNVKQATLLNLSKCQNADD